MKAKDGGEMRRAWFIETVCWWFGLAQILEIGFLAARFARAGLAGNHYVSLEIYPLRSATHFDDAGGVCHSEGDGNCPAAGGEDRGKEIA